MSVSEGSFPDVLLLTRTDRRPENAPEEHRSDSSPPKANARSAFQMHLA